MVSRAPIVLLVIIFVTALINLPLFAQQLLYSLSLSIKSLIVVSLPVIILTLLFKTTVALSSKANKIIGLIFILVCCSNFLSTFLSHYIGAWAYTFDLSITKPKILIELQPLWQFNLPSLISNDKAMLIGIISGFLFSKLNLSYAKYISDQIATYNHKLLLGLTYLIPIFVAGFIVKLKYDGVILILLKDYIVVLFTIICAQFTYILLLYFILNNFHIKQCLNNVANILPAAITGFSTMSSAASMPLTMVGAERNAKNKNLVHSVIPATVNIHLIGDCFAIPILAYAILKSFHLPEPSLIQYLIFATYFVLAKFSVAAIPGGGIIVMLPILQSHLGFTSDMTSLITALYILFDPVITCANVLGNGAFAKLIDKVANAFGWGER